MGTIAPDLNELRYFVQVARSRSFTRAARRMAMPKSSVSRAIGRLESRLGMRLLERTTRSVTLTEAGALYFDHCVRVMEEAEQADLAMGALHAVPRGHLRIAATLPFARFVLAPLMGSFLERYPELRVSLQTTDADGSLHEGDADLVIRGGPVADSSKLMRPLFRIHLGAYASPAYLRRSRRPLRTPADLEHHSCITTACGPHGEVSGTHVWTMRRGSEVCRVQVDSRVAVSDPSINHRLVRGGAGIALLGHALAAEDVAAGHLVPVLEEWQPEPVQLYALYPTRLSASPKVRALLDFLERNLPAKELAASPAIPLA